MVYSSYGLVTGFGFGAMWVLKHDLDLESKEKSIKFQVPSLRGRCRPLLHWQSGPCHWDLPLWQWGEKIGVRVVSFATFFQVGTFGLAPVSNYILLRWQQLCLFEYNPDWIHFSLFHCSDPSFVVIVVVIIITKVIIMVIVAGTGGDGWCAHSQACACSAPSVGLSWQQVHQRWIWGQLECLHCFWAIVF